MPVATPTKAPAVTPAAGNAATSGPVIPQAAERLVGAISPAVANSKEAANAQEVANQPGAVKSAVSSRHQTLAASTPVAANPSAVAQPTLPATGALLSTLPAPLNSAPILLPINSAGQPTVLITTLLTVFQTVPDQPANGGVSTVFPTRTADTGYAEDALMSAIEGAIAAGMREEGGGVAGMITKVSMDTSAISAGTARASASSNGTGGGNEGWNGGTGAGGNGTRGNGNGTNGIATGEVVGERGGADLAAAIISAEIGGVSGTALRSMRVAGNGNGTREVTGKIMEVGLGGGRERGRGRGG